MHSRSYLNKSKEMNKQKIAKVIHGMPDVNNICFLSIKGQSQLEKEINETKHIANKIVDLQALHRNEVTLEIEGASESEVIF